MRSVGSATVPAGPAAELGQAPAAAGPPGTADRAASAEPAARQLDRAASAEPAARQLDRAASAEPVARQLARWATGLELAHVPLRVQQAACRHLLDGLGTALAAARTGAAAPAVQVALGLGGPCEATVLGGATGTAGPAGTAGRAGTPGGAGTPGTVGGAGAGRVSAPAAALANGALVHALDFDDTHPGALVHATASVLPTALAVGEQVGATGAEVLRAAVAGYEVVCRLGLGAPHGFHARGMHATSVCGVMASALVASLLTVADAEHAVHALGIAGSSAGGLLEFLATGSSTKQLHPGSAALNGILAARLAAAGGTGPASVLEGGRGLYAGLADGPTDLEAVVGGLGTRWETGRIGLKPYPACQLLHVTLDALAAVRPLLPGGAARVREVRALVHRDSISTVCAPHEAKARPRSPYDARFSLPWTAAALLVDGRVDLATFTPDNLARSELTDLACRVVTVPSDQSGAAADASGCVEVEMADGQVLVGRVDRSRGTPDAPMTDDDLLAKFSANCGDDAVAGELAGLVLDLAAAPSLDELLQVASRMGASA